MSIDFILPDIGEGIVECELVEWLVKEGDLIVEDQPIADVMTDKALVQIPAMHNGTVEKLYYKQGDIAKINFPLFAMRVADDNSTVQEAGEKSSVINDKPQSINEHTSDTNKKANVEKNTSQVLTIDQNNNGKILASPAVRRVAREKGVNIANVVGSGIKGRVYKNDVVTFSQQATAVHLDDAQTKVSNSASKTIVEPICGIKAIMAKAMQNSVSTIPHFTYFEEIDVTELIALRKELKEMYAKQGIKLTMLPFFMKAMSLALKEFPIVNSQINESCTELTYFNDHNIGMAVDSKNGLLVPNIKQVQTKSILDLVNDITRLTHDARSGRVAATDLKGGTITISNIGAIGGTMATPIINKPEAAIVALGKLQQLPRFNAQGEVEARSIMQVSWSGDHRIIDGGTIAHFCNLWKSFLEKPSNMLAHLS